MIYYWPGEDHNRPSGGVRTHYDHVRILNEAGIPASILHLTPGFRCDWFWHQVPIAYAPETRFGPDDVLVCNEILGPQTTEIASAVRKVIFAQNVHYMWRNWAIPPVGVIPYTHPSVLATLVLTEYEQRHVQWAFPQHPVYVTPHGIHADMWPVREKRRQVAFMPRKHADEAQQVFGWLHAVGALDGWTVVPIDGKTQPQVADILAETAVFVPFGYPEGGTLPPFEAMAAGCTVVGYGGFASDDLMAQCGARPVPSGDSCQLARVLDFTLRRSTEDLAAAGLALRAKVLDVLSVGKEAEAVTTAWRTILA